MFCHVVAKPPAPLYSPLDGNTEAALPTVGVSYGCRENDHKPSCCKQHRLISFGFWGSGVSSGSQGFSPSGGTREQSVSSLVQLLGPGGPHRSNISLGGRISSLPLTLLLLPSTQNPCGVTWAPLHQLPISSAKSLHHIHKTPFALEGDTFTGSRAGTATPFTGHYSASHNYYLGPS